MKRLLLALAPLAHVNVPVFSQRSSAERFEPGLGVAPDVFVPETIADLLAGRDAALAAALR